MKNMRDFERRREKNAIIIFFLAWVDSSRAHLFAKECENNKSINSNHVCWGSNKHDEKTREMCTHIRATKLSTAFFYMTQKIVIKSGYFNLKRTSRNSIRKILFFLQKQFHAFSGTKSWHKTLWVHFSQGIFFACSCNTIIFFHFFD